MILEKERERAERHRGRGEGKCGLGREKEKIIREMQKNVLCDIFKGLDT